MSEKEKKRKRHEESGKGERPKKKAATTPKGTVSVELVENKELLGPILAATPGFQIPPHIKFNPYKRTKILRKGEITDLLLQSSDHPRLDYLAQEEHDGSSESQLKDYVAVYDPSTSKLQVVPVKRLVVRSTLRSETEEMREEQARKEAQLGNITAKRAALASEFGSKKSRKALEDRTLNAIHSGKPGDPSTAQNDAVAENVLTNMANTGVPMPTKAELEAAVDKSKPRPTPNLAAEYPGDVYTIDNIVGSGLMTMLEVKDWVDASTAGQGVSVSSKFVAKRIVKLARGKQIQKLKVLRFILLCINFNAALQGSGGNKPKKIPIKGKLEAAMGDDTPAGCVLAIRRKFASENGDMPRWNIDNLMTHIAAAALIVDDHEVDINDLREDLKLENKEIKQYFLELGCKLSAPTQTDMAKWKLTKAESANHFIAKLKLPLRFPKVGGARQKRRG
ncbi:similar to DNA-directed RNA polymerase I 49 kDa polypeptide [Plenodomus lingam JN3]|uniref:Similar to DNA-directed RNA polymerase I 49 kDa polypeptide n=1 Tax=Leptosphaeria maculans (strain JN3 / isolate v23.1.3 / race Av1-4-5-6-7-8) TaxID=985895 RepID=E5ABH7_LEPMJ|nr:similar to DNA-directed RNA polymerase I 49 kDa polypeptide [Plenodomus lingam JN3]CBY01018.1 similar to DNA-directed RNA polymerase I 49 kDa polypeptide [Plenodomus lingam JN3]